MSPMHQTPQEIFQQNPPRIAVLIPCLNEEISIGKVVDDFKIALPQAQIFVFDNNCTDRTAEIARAHGATVIEERRPGKGFVVNSMFKLIDADIYLMVDGDDTYSAEHAPQIIQPILDGHADMVVGTRLAVYTDKSFRPLHVFGNNLVKSLVNWIFHCNLQDIMSGYRACTRSVAKKVPVFASGFEVETELTIRTLNYGFHISEVSCPYKERPAGSFSKLHTFRDGARVLTQIASIARSYKPLTFFGLFGLLFGLIAVSFGIEVILDYWQDGYVNKIPTAILTSIFIFLSFGSIGIGLILNAISSRIKEVLWLLRGNH